MKVSLSWEESSKHEKGGEYTMNRNGLVSAMSKMREQKSCSRYYGEEAKQLEFMHAVSITSLAMRLLPLIDGKSGSMRRVVLLLTVIYIVTAQMTFTDNWDKRTFPSLFRGWQRDELTINEACSSDVIIEIIKELKHIYKRQNELINVIDRCSIINRPVFIKEETSSSKKYNAILRQTKLTKQIINYYVAVLYATGRFSETENF
ncbi:Period circadian protein [Dirofilaria immitis]